MSNLTKTFSLATLALAAGSASAAFLAYTADFSTDPGLVAVTDGSTASGTGKLPVTNAYQTWLYTGTTALKWNGSGVDVASNTNGGTRGMGIAFGSGYDAGDYTISFDITAFSLAEARLGFGAYLMEYGGTVEYRMDFVEALGVFSVVRTGDTSNVRSDLITDTQYSTTGTVSFDVTLDGTKDLVLLFSGMKTDNTTNAGVSGVITVDNVSIAAVPVPEPSTMALFAGLATLGLVLYRRRRAS